MKLEKDLDDVKINKKNALIKEYNELIEWLMLLYNTHRCKVEEEQTRLINNAFGSIQKISALIETFETNLKN